jgi:hypothetical protein
MMEKMGDSASRLILMNTKSEEIIVDPSKMDVTKFANLNRCVSPFSIHVPVAIARSRVSITV